MLEDESVQTRFAPPGPGSAAKSVARATPPPDQIRYAAGPYRPGCTPSIAEDSPEEVAAHWAGRLSQAAHADQWSIVDFDLSQDRQQWQNPHCLTSDERELVRRNLAFFHCASRSLANDLVPSLYHHLESSGCRRFLLRQAYEESRHARAFQHLYRTLGEDTEQLTGLCRATPSIAARLAWLKSYRRKLSRVPSAQADPAGRRSLMHNLFAHYLMFQGLFYQLGLVQILSIGRRGKLAGTAHLLRAMQRAEQRHLRFGSQLINQLKARHPGLWDREMRAKLTDMAHQAVQLETENAYDSMPRGMLGLNAPMFEEHLRFASNHRCQEIGLDGPYADTSNPFPLLDTEAAVALRQE